MIQTYRRTQRRNYGGCEGRGGVRKTRRPRPEYFVYIQCKNQLMEIYWPEVGHVAYTWPGSSPGLNGLYLMFVFTFRNRNPGCVSFLHRSHHLAGRRLRNRRHLVGGLLFTETAENGSQLARGQQRGGPEGTDGPESDGGPQNVGPSPDLSRERHQDCRQ